MMFPCLTTVLSNETISYLYKRIEQMQVQQQWLQKLLSKKKKNAEFKSIWKLMVTCEQIKCVLEKKQTNITMIELKTRKNVREYI